MKDEGKFIQWQTAAPTPEAKYHRANESKTKIAEDTIDILRMERLDAVMECGELLLAGAFSLGWTTSVLIVLKPLGLVRGDGRVEHLTSIPSL